MLCSNHSFVPETEFYFLQHTHVLLPLSCHFYRLDSCGLTSGCCSELSLVFSTEHSRLTELELRHNNLEDSGVHQLCEGLRSNNCKIKKLGMTCCDLTSRCCENLSLVLSAEHSHLTELYLNNNNLEDSGVHLLCEGLRNQKCQLEKLRLINCGLTSGSSEALSSVLSAEYSRLTELDLGNNKLDNSGVNLLCKGWSTCKLLKLGLWSCGLTSGCCVALSSVLSAEHSHLTQLELNDNNLQDSGVRLLCEGLRNRNCKLEKLGIEFFFVNICQTSIGASSAHSHSLSVSLSLFSHHFYRLNSCGVTSGCCGALSSVLSDEHSRLTELWLGGNNLEDSGVDQICDGLRSPNCKLEKLGLLSCHLTHECCEALSSVLSDEHSCLTKLELGQNNLGDSGVHLLCEPLRNTNCKLEKLRIVLYGDKWWTKASQ
uniref:Uncharacterized protein n=1 Tax=Erpetoichthys calabaricus TaxID=27687 RepID=A0A8C4RK82_ERPCA